MKITALNPNEYWILENRQKQNWDTYIKDEGILITHFTYIESRWDDNSVNDMSVQLATIIPADDALSTSNLNTDLYGETNHEFSTTSTPAMMANMSASGSLAYFTGGAGVVNKPVTEIKINNNGTASFWYIKSALTSGDVNGDNTCTSSDVTALYNYILYNDSSAIVNGDQNGDGSITSSDVTAVYNIILGL